MKIAILALAGVLSAGFLYWRHANPQNMEATVTSRVLVPQVTRFGVNMGTWQSWGAEQLSSNVIKNPGFEGIIDRAIVIPVHSIAGSFDDSPAYLARSDSFWDGAHYDIRTGTAAGKVGTVSHSQQKNIFGLPSFLAQDANEAPEPGEVVSVTKVNTEEVPSQWWFSPVTSFSPAAGETRPGSPGTRSLRITSMAGNTAELNSYLDAIGQRAGKLLPLNGAWSLSFWTRLEKGKGTLRVSFGRDGTKPSLSQSVPVGSGWHNVQLNFEGIDDGPPSIASLRFQVAGEPMAQVLLDDVDLRRTQDAGFPFRREVVSVLEELHPKYLRDWQGQLGDTLANRISPAFARKAYRYRPGDAQQTDYGYGLRDFLDLCLKVGADPWVIVPTTFSDEECSGLGDYLTAQRDISHFHDIVVEYGNENWNEIFRPGGIPDARLHGQAAGRCLANLRKHSSKLPIRTTINAQHANPAAAGDYARETEGVDMEAVAPYFLPSLEKNTSEDKSLHALFAGDQGRMQKIAADMGSQQKELAVYEVNLTTEGGTASGEERTPIVAGTASGTALAKTMLDALAYGVRRQCVYTLAGFDAKLPGDQGYVRIWGIARDLGPTLRLRPTGLALQLLNRTLAGDMYEVEAKGPKDVSVYSFRSERGWAAALVSASGTSQQVTVRFPDSAGVTLPNQRLSVSSKTWSATNESSEDVCIAHKKVQYQGNTVTLELAPFEFTVLLPEGTAR